MGWRVGGDGVMSGSSTRRKGESTGRFRVGALLPQPHLTSADE